MSMEAVKGVGGPQQWVPGGRGSCQSHLGSLRSWAGQSHLSVWARFAWQYLLPHESCWNGTVWVVQGESWTRHHSSHSSHSLQRSIEWGVLYVTWSGVGVGYVC